MRMEMASTVFSQVLRRHTSQPSTGHNVSFGGEIEISQWHYSLELRKSAALCNFVNSNMLECLNLFTVYIPQSPLATMPSSRSAAGHMPHCCFLMGFPTADGQCGKRLWHINVLSLAGRVRSFLSVALQISANLDAVRHHSHSSLHIFLVLYPRVASSSLSFDAVFTLIQSST